LEKKAYIAGAFDTILVLIEAFMSQNYADVWNLEYSREPSPLTGGVFLQDLSCDPLWAGRVDLFSSRGYFLRLWVVQEIALSSIALLICGNYSIDWSLFSMAAYFLSASLFPYNSLDDPIILRNIYTIAFISGKLLVKPLILESLLRFGVYFRVSDPRDHVFGVLGMLDASARMDLMAQIDYESSPEHVSEVAVRYAFVEGERSIWKFLNWVPEIRPRLEMPSWAPLLGDKAQEFALANQGSRWNRVLSD
jgi:hypothetical protein